MKGRPYENGFTYKIGGFYSHLECQPSGRGSNSGQPSPLS